MSRTFAPINTSILSVISKHLSIPKYQRPYTWKPENIDLLWEDLGYDINSPIFLGIIVLHDNNMKDETGTKRVEIIDGQQRIATIMIVMAAIRNLALIEKDFSLSADSQKAIEMSDAIGSQGYILKASNNLYSFLVDNILSNTNKHDFLTTVTLNTLNSEEEKVVRNYRRIIELVQKSKEWTSNTIERTTFLKDVKKRLLTSEVIQVTVTSEDDAYDLFETLNSRSVSLSEVNMIKNRIFMQLSSQYSDDELEQRWSKIEINAGGERRVPEDIQKFINYFWWSRYEKIPPKKIFRDLRKENLDFMLQEFEFDSKIYSKLRSTNSLELLQYRKIDLSRIKTLAQLLNLQQIYIPLLSLCRKFEQLNYWNDYHNRQVAITILKLEKFIYAYKFSSRSPAAVERMYSNAAIEFFNAKDKTQFNQALLNFEKDMLDKFPTDEEFKREFINLEYSDNNASNRLIGHAIEKIFLGDNSGIVIKGSDLEHIFPSNVENGVRKDELDLNTAKNKLGNLTYLSEKLNREKCRNKRPIDKTEYYSQSVFKQNNELASVIKKKGGWSVNDINTRTNAIVNSMWEYLQL